MVYVNQPPLITLSADCQVSTRYKKLMSRTIRPFTVLDVQCHVLTIDENGIENTSSIDRATPVGSQQSHRMLKSKNKRCPAKKLAQRPTRFIPHPQHCRTPSNDNRATIPSPMVWLWRKGWHPWSTNQYTTSLYLTIPQPSEMIARFYYWHHSRHMHNTLISVLPENNKEKQTANPWSQALLYALDDL